MNNEYSDAMQIFAKILKTSFSHLKSMECTSVVYVDDTFLQSNTYELCGANIEDTVHLLRTLGLTIHLGKLILVPTNIIEFLGFVLNSRDMTFSLSMDRRSTVTEKID